MTDRAPWQDAADRGAWAEVDRIRKEVFDHIRKNLVRDYQIDTGELNPPGLKIFADILNSPFKRKSA